MVHVAPSAVKLAPALLKAVLKHAHVMQPLTEERLLTWKIMKMTMKQFRRVLNNGLSGEFTKMYLVDMRDNMSDQSSGDHMCVANWSVHLCHFLFLAFVPILEMQQNYCVPISLMHHVSYCNAMYLHVHCRPSSGVVGVQGHLS